MMSNAKLTQPASVCICIKVTDMTVVLPSYPTLDKIPSK